MRNRFFNVTIPLGTAVSEAIDIRGADSMVIHMPAAWDAASIAFLTSPTVSGTFQPLNSAADALLEIDTPAVNTSYKVPDIKGASFIQLWSETAGVGVNQAAARLLSIELLVD